MATKTITLCDMDHEKSDKEVEAQVTVPYAFDGETYEIDLCKADFDKMAKFLDPYVRRSRPVAARPNGRKADSERAQAIREWCRERSIVCNERGRIPQDIEEAYEANDPSKAKSRTLP